LIQVLSEKNIAEFVRDMSSGKPIRFAVAFWGKSAVCRLGLKESAGGSIICNLQSGCTNPDEILELIEFNKGKNHKRFDIRTHAKLHGKLYKTDGMAVVGSSNASLNGLALESETEGWREINLATDQKDILSDLDRRFEELWAEADPVDETVVERYRPVWEARQVPVLPTPPRSGSLLEAAKANPHFFSSQPIWFVIYKSNVPKDVSEKIGERVQAGDAGEMAKNDEYWEYFNWDRQLPNDAWFIDVSIIAKARVNGIARSFDRPCTINIDDGREAQLLFRRPKIKIGEQSYAVPKADIEKISAKAHVLWKAAEGDDEGRLIAFAKAMTLLEVG